MFSFNVKSLQNGFGSPTAAASHAPPESPSSPKIDVGEIDTRAPFESVKAAVSLFGDVGSPRARPVTKKTRAEEQRLLEREAQHHMILRELDYYRDQLNSTETAKDHALKDLERANRTLLELTNKLETVTECKQVAITAAEAAKARATELEEQKTQKAQLGNDAWKMDVDAERERYRASSQELTDSKQELTNLRHDFDAALETKLTAFQKEEDALQAAKSSREKESRLLEEVLMMRRTLEEVMSASHRAEEEHLKLVAEKEVHLLVHKSAKQTADKELELLKEEYGPEDDPTQKLEEVTEAINVLQEQLNDVRAADFSSLNGIVLELGFTEKEFREAVAEENSVRSSVDSIKPQLEEKVRERSEWDNKALEAESKLEQMQNELENKKAELEAAKSRNDFEDIKSGIDKFLAEAATKRQETEDIKKVVESLRKEAEMFRISTTEAEERLQIVLKETEEAEAAKRLADEQIRNSPKGDDSTKAIESARKIRLSDNEFRSMNDKIEEFRNQADEKVATLRALMENVSASEKEELQKVEWMSKELENIQSEIEDAIKRTEMAEAAKKIVEDELQKWHINELTYEGEPSSSMEQ